jgi:hypothetical protein
MLELVLPVQRGRWHGSKQLLVYSIEQGFPLARQVTVRPSWWKICITSTKICKTFVHSGTVRSRRAWDAMAYGEKGVHDAHSSGERVSRGRDGYHYD